MKRREFISAGLAAAGVAIASGAVGPVAEQSANAAQSGPASKGRFQLKYAPHFNMFKNSAGKDPIDQLKFIADQGFVALEDNGMAKRPVEEQEKIAREMERLGIEMGVFVATKTLNNMKDVSFASDKTEIRDILLQDMRDAVEIAKRVNAKWCTVVCGHFDTGLQWDYQTSNAIDNLKYCSEICEPSNLVMVLEPLNWWRNHAGLFLSEIPQAYMICRAVGSPSCKILDDLYHQQISEGNLIPNMDKAWDEIAYFQVGDNPGRKEPTTGEINYKNIFRHIHGKGYTGIIGMEHGNSKPGVEGEQAVIDAYVEVDSF